jgi:hypothetical protein
MPCERLRFPLRRPACREEPGKGTGQRGGHKPWPFRLGDGKDALSRDPAWRLEGAYSVPHRFVAGWRKFAPDERGDGADVGGLRGQNTMDATAWSAASSYQGPSEANSKGVNRLAPKFSYGKNLHRSKY